MPSDISLGRLAFVHPREVWPHEAHDFTPWLLGNVDVLSDLLGMDLALEAAEHPVGGFSLDLIGKDQATNATVIVENQLEQSDHTHLGQILTYAAGTDPTTIVWVATSFRPEHRAAIDWLNERTDEDTRFFGVQIEVVRIGDSAPAPAFKLIAQPNDWGKQVKATAAQQAGELSGRGRLFWDFWTRFRETVVERHPGWTRSTGSTKSYWFGMTAGVANANWIFTFQGGRIGVQLEFVHPDPEVNLLRFRELAERREAIEATYGGAIEWEPCEGRKLTRIGVYGEPADISDEEQWDAWIEWLIATGLSLRTAVAATGGVPTANIV